MVCPYCRGKGLIRIALPVVMQVICTRCGGTGKVKDTPKK